MQKGLVSCIIPTYKRCDMLPRAINSVLSQTYTNIEVLVVDDNEVDSEESKEAQKLIGSYSDKRVICVKQEKHINGAEARNAGIRAAKGEYIAFLDDDDEWLPKKVEKQVEVLERDNNIHGVSCLYNEFKRGRLYHSLPPYTGDGLHLKVFMRDVAVLTSNILLRRESLMEAGLFDNRLRRHQDLQLLLDFTKEHKMYIIQEYLVKVHADSAINRVSFEKAVQVKKDFFMAVDSHLQQYPPKTQRLIKSAHYFELAMSAFKAKKPLQSIKYLLKIGFNIEAYKHFLKRIKDKKYICQES